MIDYYHPDVGTVSYKKFNQRGAIVFFCNYMATAQRFICEIITTGLCDQTESIPKAIPSDGLRYSNPASFGARA